MEKATNASTAIKSPRRFAKDFFERNDLQLIGWFGWKIIAIFYRCLKGSRASGGSNDKMAIKDACRQSTVELERIIVSNKSKWVNGEHNLILMDGIINGSLAMNIQQQCCYSIMNGKVFSSPRYHQLLFNDIPLTALEHRYYMHFHRFLRFNNTEREIALKENR